MKQKQVKIAWSDEEIKLPKTNGVIVLVDILRASSFIAVALNKNAERVIVVKEKEDALQCKRENKHYILAGERGGVKLEGFDMNNSPEKIALVCKNKTALLSSSNFCRVIEKYAKHHIPVLAGSFINAKEIAQFISKKGYDKVFIIPTGTYHFKGKVYKKPLKTKEDLLGAFFIAHELSKINKMNLHIPQQYLSLFSHKKIFQEKMYRLRYTRYLLSANKEENEKDIKTCMQMNKYPCVPLLDDTNWPYFFKNTNKK